MKIIPNAIGVATEDERHVFGSFLSRESAYRLMISVWQPETHPEMLPNGLSEENTPASCDQPPTVVENSTPPAARPSKDIEVSECSIEEDSSSAISGNECHQMFVHAELLESKSKLTCRNQSSGTDQGDLTRLQEPVKPINPPETIQFYQFHIPTTIPVAYFGMSLAVILVLISTFLFYRIWTIQAARSNHLKTFPLRDFSLVSYSNMTPARLCLILKIHSRTRPMRI